MRNRIIQELKRLAKEEYEYATAEENRPREREFYARSGRFIIERRILSELSGKSPTMPLSVRTHLPLRRFPEHTHDYVELMYVYTGSITHNIGKSTVTVSAGELIILGKNTEHSIEPSGRDDLAVNLIISSDLYELLLLEMRKSSNLKASELQAILDQGKDVYILSHTSDMGYVTNLIDNIVYFGLIDTDGHDDYILRQSLGLLLSLLCDGRNENSADKDTKTKVIDYIKTSYSTASMTECAEMLGLSPSYFSRWCVKSFGLSFKDLLMNERFYVAGEMLLKTDMPIGDIIINSGYENSSYFHKEFKKRFGTTPKKYRKLNSSGNN